MREVDYMAEKKKVPKEAGGGVIWEVKQDILKSLGLEEKDLVSSNALEALKTLMNAFINTVSFLEATTESDRPFSWR